MSESDEIKPEARALERMTPSPEAEANDFRSLNRCPILRGRLSVVASICTRGRALGLACARIVGLTRCDYELSSAVRQVVPGVGLGPTPLARFDLKSNASTIPPPRHVHQLPIAMTNVILPTMTSPTVPPPRRVIPLRFAT